MSSRLALFITVVALTLGFATAQTEKVLAPVDPAWPSVGPMSFGPSEGVRMVEVDRGPDAPVVVPVPSVDPAGPSTPALALGFKGIDGIPPVGGQRKPPDTHIAVGPGAGAAGRIVEVTNIDIAIFDKTGTSLATAGGVSAFFGPAPLSAFDPKVLFDQHSGRFFIVGLQGSSPALSVLHIAVSTTSTPSNTTTDWTKLSGSAVTSIPSCGPCSTWFDYPGIGADSDSLFVTGNLFDAGSSFRGVKIRVFDKSAVTGLLAGIHSFVDINVDDAATGFGTSIQPAHVFGATDNGNFYLINRFGSTLYRLWEITGDPAAPVLVQSGTHSWSAGTFFTPGAPQMGTAVTLDTLASRVQNAVYRSGEIWLALTSDPDSDSKSEVVWQRIATNSGSPAAPTVTDAGFIDGRDGNEWTFMPAIAVNLSGHASIVYSQSFTDQFPDIRYVTRLASDPAGTFQTSMVAATSPGFYSAFFTPSNDRWGDYAAAVVDPDDDETFCVASEKVLAAAAAGSVIWDTFIGCFTLTSFCAPPASGDWTVTQGFDPPS